MCIAEGYKGTFIAHFCDDNDSYAEVNLKEEKPGWQKDKPVERFYIKYDLKNSFTTHEAILSNQREREVKASVSYVCVTNEAKQNHTPS